MLRTALLLTAFALVTPAGAQTLGAQTVATPQPSEALAAHVAALPDLLRGKGDSPWHVEEVSVLKALDESTVRAIDVDVAEAGTGDPMTFLCQGVGNDNVVSNGLDAERCEVVGELGVSECWWSVALIQVYGAEGVVKDIDAGFGVVGDIEEMPAVYEGAGEAGEYGAVIGFDGDDGVGRRGSGPGRNGHVWIPGGDGSVDRDKEELSWFAGDQEVIKAAIEDDSCRCPCGEGRAVGVGFGDGDDQ